MYYNFIKTHGTIRMTPAMAANVISSPLEMDFVVHLVEAYRQQRVEEGQQNAKEANERSYNPFGN